MNPLLVGFILLLTVVAAMALGVALGYALFTCILHLLGRHERPAPHDGVDRPPHGRDVVLAIPEDVGIVVAVDRVGAEESAKKEDFLHQEQPDSELDGIELLLRGIEVVRDVRVVPVSVITVLVVSGCCRHRFR